MEKRQNSADKPFVECRLETCDVQFQKRVHNQSFCSKECCRVFTNARILAQYHDKKNKVMKGRVCKKCPTVLSRYNEDEYCSVHQEQNHIEKLKNWGWEVNEYGERVI